MLAALCGVAFANAFPREFTYDSAEVITNHPMLTAEQPWSALWLNSYWGEHRNSGLYRPVTILTFRVERLILGFEQAAPYAAVNLLLHACVVLLLWRLALRWIGSEMGAAVAAAVFAVHPVATAVIPNLVGRADLLATAGTLAALLAWERAFDGDRVRLLWLGAAMLCWVVGLLSKESAVAFPVIALVRDAARLGSWRALWPKRQWAYAAVVVVGIAWWCWRWWVLDHMPPAFTRIEDNPLLAGTLAERWMTALYVMGLYLRLAILPLHLSADYSFNQVPLVSSPLEPRFLAAAAALIVLAAVAVLAWRSGKSRFVALGVAFFLLALLPVSNLVVLIGTIMADRLAYLPLAGLCVALGGGAALVWARWPARGVRGAVVGAACLAAALLVVRTHLRNPTWRDSIALWRQTVLDAPNSSRAHTNRKTHLDESLSGDELLALQLHHLQRALEILEPLPRTHARLPLSNLGRHYTNMGVLNMRGDKLNDAARADFERAVDVLGQAVALEDQPSAERDWWERRQLWLIWHGQEPELLFGYWGTHHNLGIAYFWLQRTSEAIPQFEIAVSMSPQQAEPWSLLGRCRAVEGQFAEAEAALLRAVELDDADADSWRYLAQVQATNGRFDRALASIDRAIGINPDDAIHLNLRLTILRHWLTALRRAGHEDQARELIEQARAQYGVELDDGAP